MSGQWQRSTRRQLPTNWDTLRRTVQRRANNQCQATTHHPACNGTGTDCDHITPNNDHSLSNLQWLSRPCHNAKTQAEARAGWKRKRYREPPKHPGTG